MTYKQYKAKRLAKAIANIHPITRAHAQFIFILRPKLEKIIHAVKIAHDHMVLLFQKANQ